MTPITEDTPVRDIVVQYPQTRRVLERCGVDYCCGGAQPLRAAAAEAGLAPSELLGQLRQALAEPPPDAAAARDWAAAPLVELLGHIETRHHAFMKQQLPRLGALLAKVLQAHGPRHGRMLAELQEVFHALRDEIELHLMKEEQVLFPYLRRLEAHAAGRGPRPALPCASVEGPIQQMQAEHDNAGAALARMRALTGGYAPPADACPTFRALYEGLAALEADLHEHIHLENNIVFPRALALEPEPAALP
ncbi:MAG TPA: iron-sulfur cluster repair di-iron protein [Planctomycetota bacterium]|nr:iron-sulfur cluster repair di-iron protein [Planctomycetota bacterium]HRR81872.1 iron-sulfur cluster repair di-iron protein [Planctomycetota bacterium]HRT95039.1 iron-sulfur cluster repair di-iron protein [Planctomycetota bacterium]